MYWYVEYRTKGDGPWHETAPFDTESEAQQWAYDHLGDDVADVHVLSYDPHSPDA